MNKINAFLALLCLIAATSLQFSKPDYAFSADQTAAFSKAFLPSYRPRTIICCITEGGPVGTGTNCVTGTSHCTAMPCTYGYFCGYAEK